MNAYEELSLADQTTMLPPLSTPLPLSTITDDAPYRRGDGVDLGAGVDLVDGVGDGLNHQVDPIAPPLSQNSSSLISEINIRDPTTSLRHKGRPKLPSRLPSGLELSQEEATKKRKTCGFCGEKGHYRTGCSKAKANNIVYSGSSDPGGSQALPRTQ